MKFTYIILYFKYILNILKIYFLGIHFKYTLSIFWLCIRSKLQQYFLKKDHGLFLGFICINEPLYEWNSIVWRLQSHSEDLLLTIKPRDIFDSHWVDLQRMKGWCSFFATSWLWTWGPLAWLVCSLTTRLLLHKLYMFLLVFYPAEIRLYIFQI